MPDEIRMGQKIMAEPKPTPEIGIDTENTEVNNILDAAMCGTLNMSKLESFLSVVQTREQIYKLIDSMSNDSTISAVLETYAEDVCETDDHGKIVWCESENSSVLKYVDFLLDSLNVDKHVYGWTYSLVKYGDVYLRLYRESDYDDDKLFANCDRNVRIDRKLTERFDTAEEAALHELEQANKNESLKEDVNINVYNQNDRYAHYLEMVPNPGEMFELTRFGRTVAYVEAPSSAQSVFNQNQIMQPYLNYNFNRNDVEVYQADCFVHAYLEDNSSRTPEEVSIYDGDEKNDKKITYKVRRGQSLLYNIANVWRALQLLENSVLLNRLTKSSIIRVIGVEVGDMPKTQIAQHLRSIKNLIEQKTSFKDDNSIDSYTSPGPVENNIYVPTHGGVGAISTQQIGGDVDVKSLLDLDYYNNKLYGGLRVPKQYFCLRGDTKIPLLNGETVAIKELYNNREVYLNKGIMSCGSDGSFEPTTIKNIMLTRKNANFIRIYLNNDGYIDVTPDHRMMLRDGSFVEAENLCEGMHLMSCLVECNHFITKIEKLDMQEDAYDIEVESDNHTFATACGVFVHNCQTDDSTGFNGGTSLSIISSRYGKAIKRIQNTVCQMITDVVNLFLLDKGLYSYINDFTIRMNSPVTQEEIDKRDAMSNRIRYITDIMNTLNDIEDVSIKLSILKSLLTTVVDSDVILLIQEQIDKLEQEAESESEETETSETVSEFESEIPSESEVSETEEETEVETSEESETSEEETEGEESYLPSPEELNIDMTRNEA